MSHASQTNELMYKRTPAPMECYKICQGWRVTTASLCQLWTGPAGQSSAHDTACTKSRRQRIMSKSPEGLKILANPQCLPRGGPLGPPWNPGLPARGTRGAGLHLNSVKKYPVRFPTRWEHGGFCQKIHSAMVPAALLPPRSTVASSIPRSTPATKWRCVSTQRYFVGVATKRNASPVTFWKLVSPSGNASELVSRARTRGPWAGDRVGGGARGQVRVGFWPCHPRPRPPAPPPAQPPAPGSWPPAQARDSGSQGLPSR